MVRIGIIGAGIIAGAHIEAIQAYPESCMLVAVADIVAEKAQQAAEEMHAAAYTDYQEMCRRESLDAVIINLPHFLHCEAAVYCARQGVHVLVEKPMAITAQECETMIAEAKANDVQLAVGHVQRYFPAYQRIKQIIADGTFGKLCMISETRNIDYFNGRPAWFLDKKLSGGGIVMNYGAHSLDKIFYTTGLKVEHADAALQNFLTKDTVEASAQVMLKLAGGVSASLNYCGYHVPNQYEIDFYFTGGAAKITEGCDLWLSRNGAYERCPEYDLKVPLLTAQLGEFLKLLRGEESEMATAAYGLKIVTALEGLLNKQPLK